MPSDNPVSHISDTARWVALYRAMESDRPDALFHDPYARKLAGEEGEAILRGMKKGVQYAWPMIVRTAVMDEIIERCVNREGYDGVMNLAAGLDTRPYRLDLPGNVKWFDVDLPDILTYKETQLAGERPHCVVEFAKADLTDESARAELFQRVGSEASRLLVITEGLLIYLTREQVAGLARDLHAQTTFAGWLIDLGSPRLLKMMHRTWGKQLERGQAPLIFGPEEGTAFFEPCGWKEVEYRAMFEEAVRLKRTMKFAWLWRFLGRLYPKKKQEEFRRMSGVVVLGRES
jgi:methyltransferase (TIGR00027 family)